MHPVTRSYEIEINGEKVYFDAARFDEGQLSLAPGTMGEQCEDCAGDILQTGRVSHSNGPAVKCACGARYEASEVEF